MLRLISSFLLVVVCAMGQTTFGTITGTVTTGGRECKNYDTAGYVKDGKVPKDGFDNDFIYTSDGRNYELISLGNDGKEGGDGPDRDVNSKDL